MGKLIDALYYLVVTAIIGGFVVQGALKLTPTLEHTFGTAALGRASCRERVFERV